MYRPEWTIDEVDAGIAAIRDDADPIVFPVAPDAHARRIGASFAMARGG